MNKPSSTPQAIERPQPLPPELLPSLVAARQLPMLVALDYDGTLAPIVPDPDKAYPAHGAEAVLKSLAQKRKFVQVAILTGRSIEQLSRLLTLPPEVTVLGVHGLELKEPTGSRHLIKELNPKSIDALEKVRRWIKQHIPQKTGFRLEDKKLSIALHYRNVAPQSAQPLVQSFEAFVLNETPELRLLRGKMVAEAIPREISKGEAIRFLLRNSPGTKCVVYFGDDVTDEDAFYELRDTGITVRVGDNSPTWAKYRVEEPKEVIVTLESLAQALEHRQSSNGT